MGSIFYILAVGKNVTGGVMANYSGVCILFGAGGGGENALSLLKLEGCNISAIVDNDLKKHNTFLDEIPIYAPAKLNCDLIFDKILIASGYSKSILAQLAQYNISQERIIVLPQYYLKSNRFSDQVLYSLAWDFIVSFSKIMSNLNIRYWLDYGTLLGVVRDNDLIPWDSDLDFCILDDNKSYFINSFSFISEHISSTIGCDVKIELIKGVECEHSRVFISCNRDNVILDIDVFIKFNFSDFVCLEVMDRVERYDAEHYVTVDFLNVKGIYLPVPNKYDQYLTRVYGSWCVANKEWTLYS